MRDITKIFQNSRAIYNFQSRKMKTAAIVSVLLGGVANAGNLRKKSTASDVWCRKYWGHHQCHETTTGVNCDNCEDCMNFAHCFDDVGIFKEVMPKITMSPYLCVDTPFTCGSRCGVCMSTDTTNVEELLKGTAGGSTTTTTNPAAATTGAATTGASTTGTATTSVATNGAATTSAGSGSTDTAATTSAATTGTATRTNKFGCIGQVDKNTPYYYTDENNPGCCSGKPWKYNEVKYCSPGTSGCPAACSTCQAGGTSPRTESLLDAESKKNQATRTQEDALKSLQNADQHLVDEKTKAAAAEKTLQNKQSSRDELEPITQNTLLPEPKTYSDFMGAYVTLNKCNDWRNAKTTSGTPWAGGTKESWKNQFAAACLKGLKQEQCPTQYHQRVICEDIKKLDVASFAVNYQFHFESQKKLADTAVTNAQNAVNAAEATKATAQTNKDAAQKLLTEANSAKDAAQTVFSAANQDHTTKNMNGRPLVGGLCTHGCSSAGYCGSNGAYEATDCRACV